MHRRYNSASGRIKIAVDRPATGDSMAASSQRCIVSDNRYTRSDRQSVCPVRSRQPSISKFNRPFSSLAIKSNSPLKCDLSDDRCFTKGDRIWSLEAKLKQLDLPSFDPLASVIITDSKNTSEIKKRETNSHNHRSSVQETTLALTDTSETSFDLRSGQAIKGHLLLNYSHLPGKVEIDTQISEFFFEIYFNYHDYEKGKRPDSTFIQKSFVIRKRNLKCYGFWFVFRVLEPGVGNIGFFFTNSKHRELDIFERFNMNNPRIVVKKRPGPVIYRPNFESFESAEDKMSRLSQETSKRIENVKINKIEHHEVRMIKKFDKIMKKVIEKQNVFIVLILETVGRERRDRPGVEVHATTRMDKNTGLFQNIRTFKDQKRYSP